MKKLLIILPIFLIILIVGLLGAFFWWKNATSPLSATTSPRAFLITKGMAGGAIAQKLESEKIIRNALAFRVFIRITGVSGSIQAGEYTLSPDMSLAQIVQKFTLGPDEIWVTIQEGLRVEEVANKFATSFDLSGEAREAFIEQFLDNPNTLEGLLFPDTYLFPKAASASAVVRKMRSTFDLKYIQEMKDEAAKRGLDFESTVTMASLLERETLSQAERPIVAGVLYKRLNAGWPLQVDATVQYAIASTQCNAFVPECDWWPDLTRENIETPSRYNTYKNPGLPPAPIANPGLISLRAAIFFEDSPYWFYIHDSSGKIHFAETLEGHNENVRKYLGK